MSNRETDGLIRPCISCGQQVPFDYTVDDDFWTRFVHFSHPAWGRDVLCLPCLARLAGPVIHDHIRVIYFSAEGWTSIFTPEIPLPPEDK